MATATKAKTAAVKVETISTRQLAGALAEKHEISQKSANLIIEDTIALITKHLKKGARIRLNGLGILVVRKRGPRMGRNPATGEAIKIKASKKVAFRASKELKESI
jgi:DNA-binding protein HU-beta